MRMKIELFKCKECGGCIYAIENFKYMCRVCGKIFDAEFIENYNIIDEYDFFHNSSFFRLLSSIEKRDVYSTISNFNDCLAIIAPELEWDFTYYVELTIGEQAIVALSELEDNVINHPSYASFVDPFIVTSIAHRDYIYRISEKTKLSFPYMITLVSHKVQSVLFRADKVILDRWENYGPNSDAMNDLWKSESNLIRAAEEFAKYGGIQNEIYYRNLVVFNDRILNSSYPHRYYRYSSYVTEDIGLDDESKERRNKKKIELEALAKKVKAENQAIKDKRLAEEAKVAELEKQKRIFEYWLVHPEEKAEIKNELASLKTSIEEAQKKMAEYNLNGEIAEIKLEIAKETSLLSNLGLFAFKEKKDRGERIEYLRSKINQTNRKVANQKAQYQKEIDDLKKQILVLENDLIRDR